MKGLKLVCLIILVLGLAWLSLGAKGCFGNKSSHHTGSSGGGSLGGHHFELGSLWAWGDNRYGQLGFGYPSTGVITPTKVSNEDWSMIAIGAEFTVALKTDGTIWGWGNDLLGQIAIIKQEEIDWWYTNTNIITTPTQIVTDTDWAWVACAKYHTLACKTDGTLWGCGYNYGGGLGVPYDNDNRYIRTLTRIGTDTDWAWADCGNRHNIAVKTDGTLWSWGIGTYGCLGGGGDAWSPGQIGLDTDWATVSTAISAGVWCSAAIKTDGTLWVWGQNNWGQLGIGEWHNDDTAYEPIPTQVGTATNWSQISVGGDHMLALKDDGTLWVWGHNCAGQLGLGDSGTGTQRVSPTQLGTDTDWVSVEAYWLVSFARKFDGTVWAWGSNFFGMLGIGSADNDHHPTPIHIFGP